MGRLRKIKNANELIKSYKWLLSLPTKNYFKNTNDVYLEIGSGKGNFIINNAIQFPNRNFIAFERDSTIVLKMLKKIKSKELPLENLLVINDEAKNISSWFDNGTIKQIYLNFVDPWPKKRHEKNRLTFNNYLEIYKYLLIPKGRIEFKTDNYDLYTYSLASFKNHKYFTIVNSSDDLYNHNELLKDNIPTEYETKFLSQNKKICKIVVTTNI